MSVLRYEPGVNVTQAELRVSGELVEKLDVGVDTYDLPHIQR